MADIQTFIIAHWGLVLFWLAVGTTLTRVLDAVAKALPQYPRLTHFAQVVDELVVDVVDVVTAVGKTFTGVVPKVATTSLVLFLALGCSFFSSPGGHVVECSAAAAGTVLANLCPPPITPLCVAVAQTAYEEACQAAANAGADQEHAHKAGLSAARGSLDKLKKRGVKLDAKP